MALFEVMFEEMIEEMTGAVVSFGGVGIGGITLSEPPETI